MTVLAAAQVRLPSISHLLRARCVTFADRPAYIAFGTRLHFARLLRDAETFAAWLQGQGIEPGERVGILLPNCFAFPIVAFGTLLAGAVLAPLNPLYTRREIAEALVRLRPALVVASPLLAASLPNDLACPVVSASLSDGLGWKAWAIRRLSREPLPPRSWASLAQILRHIASPKQVESQPHDLAMLQATGGSTGTPKYARLTHGNLLSALDQLLFWSKDQLPPATRRRGLMTLAALPLYHSFGFVTCMLQGVEVGGCAVLIPDARRLDDIAAAWRRHPIEVFPGVNTLFRRLLAQPAFLAALKARRGSPPPLVTAGGMALAETTAADWKALAGYPILQGYGSTETTSAVSCTAPGQDYDGCVGPPFVGTTVRIIDAEGKRLPVGEVGELVISGGQISTGYWDGAEVGSHIEDGWFRTGDLAIQQPDGRLRLMGRLKEMVIVSGFKVYPAEIEAYIGQHPAVAECAVIGVPDVGAGEAVMLFVVLQPGCALDDVESFARRGLAAYKRPRRCLAIESLPKTLVGKIVKAELVQLISTVRDAHSK